MTPPALAALLLAAAHVAVSTSAMPRSVRLEVPIVKQAPERCGPAALEMVLRYYAADSAALAEPDRAYDRALKGALITDLAAAARRAGFDATVATLAPHSLVGLLAAGVPPIVLFQKGAGPITAPHYAVVTAWDSSRGAFVLNDGGPRPVLVRWSDLAKRLRTAGSQGLVVRARTP